MAEISLHLIDLLRRYYFVGGMPEAVKYFAEKGNSREIREIQQEIIKSYVLDVGLLGAIARSPVELLVQGERLFNEYEGAFVENYVAQQLVSHFQHPLYYWRSRGGKAELDFLYEFPDQICPLEVKAGINPKSKSLKSYALQFRPTRLLRTNLLNFKKTGQPHLKTPRGFGKRLLIQGNLPQKRPGFTRNVSMCCWSTCGSPKGFPSG